MLIAPPASTLWAGLEWLGVCAGGFAIARLLTLTVRPLVDGDTPRAGSDRSIEFFFVMTAMALWWWEAYAAGQFPASGAGSEPVVRSLIATRFAAHVVFGGLLAAAAWIDLRYRVIPDAITMPGALMGLLWTGVEPGILPPISQEVVRSFAAPQLEPDLLGAFGGLRMSRLPTWLGAAPVLSGLSAALSVFFAWWATCTAPEDSDADTVGAAPALIGPRAMVLAVGGSAILLAWWRGGMPWAAQVASLVGLLVAAGLVWLTRIGASWALGQEALGFGDVTLMAMAGAWLGWQPCVLAFFLAVFIGMVHGLVQIAARRGNELPFGPSLCAALAVVVGAWAPLWETVRPYFERPGELVAVSGAVIVLSAVTLAIWRRVRGAVPPES